MRLKVHEPRGLLPCQAGRLQGEQHQKAMLVISYLARSFVESHGGPPWRRAAFPSLESSGLWHFMPTAMKQRRAANTTVRLP